MASLEESEEYSDFIPVRRKNMRRGKPQQQIYRPGSGPLRKSNNIEDSESDTNILINSRQDHFKKGQPEDTSRFRSEGSSPRDKIIEVDDTPSLLKDISLNIEATKRIKKPEQMHYVPRALAQAREVGASQESNPDSFAHANGNGNGINHTSKTRVYGDKNQMDKMERNEWREQSPSTARTKRFEPRGTNNGQSNNWNRTRDTRSVEHTGLPIRPHNSEKFQSKPPSGRRHSTVGIEPEKRYTKTLPNLDNMPPRFRKKFLADQNIQSPEEGWDGSSVTFQSHPKNPSYHQMRDTYHTLPNSQNLHNQHHSNSGYHTLPNKQRGRGRLGYEYETPPGSHFHCITPDRIGSPCDSRPPTPPINTNRKPDSRPHTPVNIGNEYQNYNRSNNRTENRHYENTTNESGPRNQDRRDTSNRRRDFNNRRHDYVRDGNYHNRDNYNHDWDDVPRETHNRETPNRRDDNNRDRHHGHSGRDNRRGRGNYTKDRRRDNRDNRRERDMRSSNRDYNDTPKYSTNEENWDDEIGNNTNLEEQRPSLQLSPISPEEKFEPIVINPDVSTTLDWSEEVELNDKLEAEYLSDALTRSSSMASLQNISTKSLLPHLNALNSPTNSNRKNRRRNRNRSGARENSNSRNRHSRSRQNSTTSIDSRDSFKVPFETRPRKTSRESQRETSYDHYQNSSRNISRDNSWDRHHPAHSGTGNWRDEIVRSRNNSERDNRTNIEEIKNIDPSSKKAGVIVLPQQREPIRIDTQSAQDHPRYPETSRQSVGQQKTLFDPNNPTKPIIVKSSNSRGTPGFSDNADTPPPQIYTTDQFGNMRPPWYDENSEEFHSCHYPALLRDVKRADSELQSIINKGFLLINWDTVDNLRLFLKEALQYLICRAIKFCQSENVEQHFWKILYHNIIEVTRKAIKSDPDNKEKYKDFLLYLIDEGSNYFERLLSVLEDTYEFKLNNFLGDNNTVSHKGLGLVGLALVSAQKLFLFLGDLGRYREEVNETSNYGKCRQWYIKSHEINPKNGKPYNQLAILAVYARRKLDAVYYYMRSLMSSNPVPSAREKLVTLLDENRKKYEQGEKKRREERLERQRLQMKQKESDESTSAPSSLRKETWIHPGGGRRVHRTTQANLDQNDSDAEDLSELTSVEVNKRFVISYLHVHGKLITKIGMETFQEAALQMLKEFRALLQHSPVPLPCNRFLQLLALNMFAIESTQLKDPELQSQPGYRSELQERALVVSLQMFNLILERCVSILQDHMSSQKDETINCLPPDANVLLPAIKIWCDWMLCHTNIWNPPPSTQDFKVGSPGDVWTRLATLMNLMEHMDHSSSGHFLKEPRDGYEAIRLPEDGVLYGFTPLMYTAQEATYAPKDLDAEMTHLTLRLSKLLFFGTVYLCGVDPPVLKLEIEDDVREYVSVVCSPNSRDSPPAAIELVRNNDILLESFSDEDEVTTDKEKITYDAPTEIRDLLTRKVELEKRKRSHDLHMQRVKKILSQSVVSVHMEVRPKYLVPDTNCFIDHLDGIQIIAQSHCYTLMVPIVVLSELEGLSRGGKAPTPDSRTSLDPQHIIKVAGSAKNALDFLKTRHSSLKCVTTKGAVLASTAFSTEDDTTWDNSLTNDDKILTTCLVLCKGHKTQPHETTEGEPRHLEREVVLLTDDRNLRVKAYARDVPVRELPDFMRWAGLG
ncbi:uncharacterized protein isoform X1 [Leptinotarsa decemlineata]|uniref:uncharacterized protein isoform X1 n=2 Tax=Leptinotarsa decemlineata TaxID=7539 RepID=UPI003D309534